MTDMNYDGIGITVENYVAVVEIQRGPNNFFDTQMIKDLADGKMEASKEVRAVVNIAARANTFVPATISAVNLTLKTSRPQSRGGQSALRRCGPTV